MLENPDNILTQDKLFVDFLGRSHIKKLLNEGDISQTEYDAFFVACLCFKKKLHFILQSGFLSIMICWKKPHFSTFLKQKVAFKMYWGYVEVEMC